MKYVNGCRECTVPNWKIATLSCCSMRLFKWTWFLRPSIHSKQASIVMTNCCDTVYGTQLFHPKLHLIWARAVAIGGCRIHVHVRNVYMYARSICHWMLIKLFEALYVCDFLYIWDGCTLNCNLFICLPCFIKSFSFYFSHSFVSLTFSFLSLFLFFLSVVCCFRFLVVIHHISSRNPLNVFSCWAIGV